MNKGESLRPLLAKIELVHRWAALRGEGHTFNIFSLLREEHDEVGLHTAFLSVLLDRFGNHGLGNAFLQLFLTELDLGISPQANLGDSCVERERRRDGTGQIDLLIALPSARTVVVVENKIYTGDQPRQLERYHHYARTRVGDSGTVCVVYLTLRGTDPSPKSLGSLSLDQVKSISYRDDILRWLATCIEKAALHPPLRETLVQYSDLIKKLTGQSMSEETQKEIRAVLAEGNNAELAQMIVENWGHLKWHSTWAFWREMEAAVLRWTSIFPDLQVLDVNKYNEDNLNRLYFYQRGKHFDFGLTVKLGRLRKTQSDDLCLALCTSDEGSPPFFGLAVIRSGEWREIHKEDAFKPLLTRFSGVFDSTSHNDWWLGWRFFESRQLDFVEYSNPSSLAVVNPAKRAETIEALCKEIEEVLLRFNLVPLLDATSEGR